MAASSGNEFWKARSRHGRKKKFTAVSLLKACNEFFRWNANNPLKEEKVFCYKGKIVTHDVDKVRVMTLKGLYNFLGIDSTTWAAWREVEDFSIVVASVEQDIWNHKFQSASAGLANSSIISQELGLVNKQSIDHSGNINSANVNIKVDKNTSPDEAARIYQDMVRSGKGGE